MTRSTLPGLLLGPTNPPLNKMAQSSVNCAPLTLYCPLCHYSHSLVLPLSSPGTEPCPSHQLYLIRNDTGFCCRLPLTLWAVFTLSAVSFPGNGLHSFPHHCTVGEGPGHHPSLPSRQTLKADCLAPPVFHGALASVHPVRHGLPLLFVICV